MQIQGLGKSGTNKYLYNGKEHDEETGWDDFGARMYNSQIGRWHNIDPLAIVYHSYSPYNYTLNNPIYYKDPDGKRVVAYDEETQGIILGYITEQLGENNGFSFNKKGVLKYSNKELKKAKKGFNEEQISIADGLKEVTNSQDKVINVKINENSSEFTVDIMEQGFVKNENGGFVYENGVPKREGWRKTKYEAIHNTEKYNGALFWSTSNETTGQAYGYLLLNRKKTSTLRLRGEGGKLTIASESSAFIHEMIDHGLDFIKNGNINKSSGQSVDNVKFHNQALKNISKGKSPLRTSHHDG